ncbi:HlyD family type I secretion periplasmic adaptor subunit [Burkholderia thailandensis]|uniref:HlyD family type I secretion periplasmic adaptor subunit n=1 Tax=Burkholderia thailandensis TaxID=57975 RepID=UPI002D7952F1|nr:HlyD family type I secretion periplasmic adaptor subunit [Burkholderia thailandensis]WRS69936.1 HlyD family type I secretion periplasmic adaptor subunit [Burkholderia thailandensis]
MSLGHRWQAWRELWGRYREVFSHAWQHRCARSVPDVNADEAEFLPAALSLQAQPVSPAGRLGARVLIALILLALLWSVFGKVDIVATATGKIIPSNRTKTIASVEVASVRAIHVDEGQKVKAGDVLIELDSRAVESERDKAEGTQLNAKLQAARARAMIEAMTNDKAPRFPEMSDVPGERWREAGEHLNGQWRDYVAKRERLDAQIQHLTQSLPLVARRAHDYADLARNNDVSQHAYLEKEQARIDLQGQLQDAKAQRLALIAETRRVAQDALEESQRVLNDSTQDARRAGIHGELLKLVSPIDGTVQQLAVHTVGGVVPAAQTLMQVVPENGTVEVEAFLENKDVGFIREGQRAAVKVDAFDYTKYGTVPAHVSHVSRDAIQDEKRGLIYSVKVVLDSSVMDVDGRTVRLTSGMSTNVEIKTGTRRVIGYVLSPLVKHAKESLRER